MFITELTSADFESFIEDNEIVFIDFWASWCAPCKQFYTVFEHVATEFPSIQFATVNIQEQQDLSELFEVRSIPHLMICKEGIVIYSEAGSIPESTLKSLAIQSLAADVREIRAQLDKQE